MIDFILWFISNKDHYTVPQHQGLIERKLTEENGHKPPYSNGFEVLKCVIFLKKLIESEINFFEH